MSAATDLQSALVARLGGCQHLTGVFDGAPARADYPYIVLDCGTSKDWSCSSHKGEDVIIKVAVWDDDPARFTTLEDAVSALLEQPPSLSNWKVMSFRYQARRRERNVPGPWSVSIEYRAKLIEWIGEA